MATNDLTTDLRAKLAAASSEGRLELHDNAIWIMRDNRSGDALTGPLPSWAGEYAALIIAAVNYLPDLLDVAEASDTHGSWWLPYQLAADRGSVMGIWSAEDDRNDGLVEAIDDALRADAAGWFAKEGTR